MRKLAAKSVPKCLNADQKRVRLTMSKEMCHHFEKNSSNFWIALSLWKKHGSVTMIQRLKSNPKSGSMESVAN
jgi:hypothetical protein